MASVGEPINRPRHTGQRDRSQTVLAAPRDTREPHRIKPAGAPLEGRPGVILQLIGFVIAIGFSFVAHGTALEVYAPPVTSIAAAVIVCGHYLAHRSRKAYAPEVGVVCTSEKAPEGRGKC